jgi:hypothetical protein
MLLYGNGRPINTNPNKDYRRLVTQLSFWEIKMISLENNIYWICLNNNFIHNYNLAGNNFADFLMFAIDLAGFANTASRALFS